MRRTISRRVIGNAGPAGPLGGLANMGKDAGNTCWNSITGFVFGMILFTLTFLLPFYAARTEKDSKDVARLEVMSVEEIAGKSGKFLLSGHAEAAGNLQVPRGSASDILGFRYTVEEYVTRTETHTETENGKQVEVTEEVTEWETNTDRSRTEWVDIRFGPLTLHHSAPHFNVDLPWRQIFQEGDENTRLRETVEVVDGNFDGLLAVELANGQPAAEPDFFRLCKRTKDELVAAMNAEEETQRWVLVGLSVLLWTISINLILGPAMLMFNLFPVKQVGGCARGLVTLVAFLFSCVITWITYVLTRFWWVVIILIIGFAVWLMLKAKSSAPEPNPDMDLDSDDSLGSAG